MRIGQDRKRQGVWPLLAAALALVGAGGLSGCGNQSQNQAGKAAKEITPGEFQLLTQGEQARYRNVVLRVPASWGGVLLPFDSGPYKTPLEKTIHSGDLITLMGLYNQSLFELKHPRVRMEYINFDMWSDNYKSALAVAINSRHAPAYYIARDVPQTIEQGLYADLTPLMQKWDQAKMQPEASVHEGTLNGHIYTLAANELSAVVIRYRKDWFREAGIFNEYGEPGPRSDWTWEDFRAACKKLTNPAKKRFGFAYEMSDFLFNNAHGLRLYVPDLTGKHTWRFNADDPLVLESLKNAREMVNVDKSVNTTVSMGWFEYHQEFDASHAAMIVSWAAHLPAESLENPLKFGPDKPFAQTVGMVTTPGDATGLRTLLPMTNLIGFDPTLTPEQLEVAFEWVKEWFYGDVFLNNMRAQAQQSKALGKRNSIYATLLTLPYKPKENLLDKPLSQVFPPDYIRLYDALHTAPAPPLPRQFGLREPPTNEFNRAVKAMYSEAITGDGDLKALIAKHASLINTTLLDFGGPQDRSKTQQFYTALADFYRQHYPRFYQEKWLPRNRQYLPAGAQMAKR
ncbi:MAG TPA: extracellular solute-binding protein [Chthonomonadaceae bacterium]|nr:extracellular solute-binding protein [Chthonomonadaceae bacterium]